MSTIPANKREKYGVLFNADAEDLEIELWMIARDDDYLKSKATTRFSHFRLAISLCWPTDDHHRWTDLILKSYCENEINVFIGCSDSCKTYTMSKIALIDYWADPYRTLSLMSTTEGRGAELRIWGAVKSLFNDARSRYDWLAGNPIDYLKTITTESIDEEGREARNLRAGLIVIPCKVGGTVSSLAPFIGIKSPRLRHTGDEVQCFPAGTLVDTPSGSAPIETLKVNDEVLCAAGIGKVTRTFQSQSKELVRVRFSDGREFCCTPDHKIFTQQGWEKARELTPCHYIFSHAETMQILWGNVSRHHQPAALQRLPGVSRKAMSRMFPNLSSEKVGTEVLQQVMSGDLASETTRISVKDIHQGAGPKFEAGSSKEVSASSRVIPKSFKQNIQVPALRYDVFSEDQFQNLRFMSEQSEEMCWMRERFRSCKVLSNSAILLYLQKQLGDELRDQGRGDASGNDVGIGSQPVFQGPEIWENLFHRRGPSKNQTGGGGRWCITPNKKGEAARCGKRKVFDGAWVDSVEVFQCGDNFSSGKSEKRHTVYNLSVDIHPSYSVEGLIVHNCMSEGFLSAYSNWFGKSDFRGMMAGNFMETDDPLGIASEPIDGWDSFSDSGRTQSWKSRFFNANVVALDGRDSPNDDFPVSATGKPRYGYLISEKKRKAVLETHGEDSWQWWSQCVGKPAKGMDIWRVLSRDFCKKHGASDEVVWQGDSQVKLYALDPAYGGGDLCVGRYLQLGIDDRNKQTLFFHPPEVIPIKANTGIDPEDQIASFIHTRLEALGVPPENCFYDSFGRGTLGHAFARLFGAKCPVPVDSGAQATNRPVRFDLFVGEGQERRLKRCDEHYKKFITEMYFSVREAIDSDQVRGLDQDSIREGSARKFTKNKDTKLEIEPKDEYKERHQGKSPDRMDNAAIACEGARQRGFKIERLGTDLIKKNAPDWLDKLNDGYKTFLKERQLKSV